MPRHAKKPIKTYEEQKAFFKRIAKPVNQKIAGSGLKVSEIICDLQPRFSEIDGKGRQISLGIVYEFLRQLRGYFGAKLVEGPVKERLYAVLDYFNIDNKGLRRDIEDYFYVEEDAPAKPVPKPAPLRTIQIDPDQEEFIREASEIYLRTGDIHSLPRCKHARYAARGLLKILDNGKK